jgi:hypothetical protein
MTAEPNGADERNDGKRKPQTFIQLFQSDAKFRVEVGALVVGLLVLTVYFCQLRISQNHGL